MGKLWDIIDTTEGKYTVITPNNKPDWTTPTVLFRLYEVQKTELWCQKSG